jgi:3'(2'), 5'-bisphosphate nucleotidase
VINFTIKSVFPNDLIIGEEDATEISDGLLAQIQSAFEECGISDIDVSSQSAIYSALESKHTEQNGRFWTVDPIDGTKGFIRGDQYAVCAALIDVNTGRPLVSCIGCPNLQDGIVCQAIKGHGVFKCRLGEGFERLAKVDKPILGADLRTAVFAGAFETLHTKTIEVDTIKSTLKNSLATLRLDSQAKYVILALNGAQVYYRRFHQPGSRVHFAMDYTEAVWDNAPGELFVRESGGQVTDFAGNPLIFSPKSDFTVRGGIVASTMTPSAHQTLLDTIKALLPVQ